MNLKKAKRLRRLVYGNKVNQVAAREYAQTNKAQKRFSLADIVLFKKAGKELEKTFVTSTKIAVKLRAQYQRTKKKIMSPPDNTGNPIAKLSQFERNRTKTMKNRDKRIRKKLKLKFS